MSIFIGFWVNGGWKKIPGRNRECVPVNNMYSPIPFNMIVYSWPFEIQHLKMAVTLKDFATDGVVSMYVSKDAPMITRISLFYKASNKNEIYVAYQQCSPASQVQVGNVQTLEFDCSCNKLPVCNSVLIFINTNMGEPYYICEIKSRQLTLS